MKIALGSDHGGFRMKQMLLEHLSAQEVEFHDFGSYDEEIVRYPHYAREICTAIQRGEFDRGILLCSTGIGMSIIANKFRGIRASMVSDHYGAIMTRKHNDSNVLCLGGRVIGDLQMQEILDVWLNTDYEGGRHDISLDLIRNIEDEMFHNTNHYLKSQ